MNENENTKICPLRAAICYGDSCAWYMQGCRRCALLVLGEACEIATTTAIIIPKCLRPAVTARSDASAAGAAAAAGKPIS